MILTCPACTTRYFADDSAIGPDGRNVRCAACGHSWFVEGQLLLEQTAPDDLLPSPRASARAPLSRAEVERMRQAADPDSPTAKIRAKEHERRRQAGLRAAAIAWGGAGVTLAATASAAVAFHEDVAKVWPQAASAYAAFGMQVNTYGIEFGDLQVDRDYEGPTPVLVVSGTLRNLTAEPKGAPVLLFSLRDEGKAEVYRWMVSMEGEVLSPGGAAAFSTIIENPPIQAEELEATFATAKEIRAGGTPVMPIGRRGASPFMTPPDGPAVPLEEPVVGDEDGPPVASGDAGPSVPVIRAGPLDPSAADGAVTLAALRR